MKSDLFLEEARLGPRNTVLLEHDERRHLAGVKRRFHAYTNVDLAHVVMLIENAILDRERGSRLLRALIDIDAAGVDGFAWAPESGSCLVQFEHHITQQFGDDVAGRLQTARSRNDQEGAVERLYLRDLILDVSSRVLQLGTEVLSLASEHTTTVMPGYTHLQHAQPWTFGHYLMRQVYIFERDLQRLRRLYERTNLSALGGAAQAGTSWPISRSRTAELLGHDGLVVNSNDAGEFARDHVEEALSVLAIMMSNVGRLATDFYVWSSWEFSLLEIDDGLAGTSSIMPQKKNPHALERTKALAGQAAGWLPAAMSCQRGVLSTDLDMVYGEDLVSQSVDSCVDALALLAECVRTLVVHEDVMAERAGVYWTTASHLADEIVRRFDLPFRTAHHIVGAFVKASIEAREAVAEARGERLDEAAQSTAGRRLGLSDIELREILDAHNFVRSRRSTGSVHPDEVDRQIQQMSQSLSAHAKWQAEQHESIAAALESLHLAAASLASQ